MRVAVGLDIGVRRIAAACPKMGWTESIDLGKPGMLRHRELLALGQWVWENVNGVGAALWIERPYLSGSVSNPTTTINMAEVVGAIQAAVAWEEVTQVNPSSWKSKVVQNASASKDEIQAFLIEHHPDLASLCRTEDEYDAMCIGLYGDGRASGEILPPAPKPKKRRAKKP